MEPRTLDSDQRSALDAILAGGSRRVFGGPGTGKSTVIIEALAALAERDGRDSVRAVTPSRQSATRLRDELSLRLGLATRGPLARSMSSFAYDVVATHRGPSFPVRLISGGEQDSDMKALLDGEIADGTGGYWPESLGPEVRVLREFRTQLRDLLSRARDAGLVGSLPSSEPLLYGLDARGREHNVPEWVAAAKFLDTYLRLSARARGSQIDPAAIVDEATEIVVGGGYEELTARTLLVDDAQDFTVAQWRFLDAWQRHRGPVIAFGDPDLATSGFRGATPTLFTGAENIDGDFWEPSVVLTTNHRQGGAVPHVLGVIAAAIPGAAGRHRSYPEPAAPSDVRGLPDFDLTAATASSPAGEYDIIARYIQDRTKSGVAAEDIAVIVRSGSIAEGLVTYLTANGIASYAETTGSPLREHPAVDALLTIVSVGVGFSDLTPDVARKLLTGPIGRLSALDYRRFRRALRIEAIGAEDYRLADDLLLEAMTIPGAFATSVARAEKGVALVSSLISAVRANRDWQIDELLWLVWSKSGRADVWASESRGTGPIAARAHESLDAVLTLFSVAATALENEPTESVTVFLERVLGQHVPNDTLTPRATVGSVAVCTPAASMGREFDSVVVAGLNEGVWPNLRVRSALVKSTLLPYAVEGANLATLDQRAGILADELRQFLVAMSRARSAMLVTAISSEDESPSGLYRIVAGEKLRDEETGPMEPARNSYATVFAPDRVFASLAELVGYARSILLSDKRTDAEKSAAALAVRELAARNVRGADPSEWLGLDLGTARALFAGLPAKLSPSGLTKFTESNLDWFVSQVSGGSAGIDAAVGTLLHASVENAPEGTARDLESTVNERWHELAFDAPWQAIRWRKLADKMVVALADYIRTSASENFTPVANEGRISVDVHDPASGAVIGIVSGSIDRVEMKDDHAARIIDIKTGKTVESADKHMQLKAYQWALKAGAVDELPSDATSAGAALLYPRVAGSKGLLFTLKVQKPLTDEQIDEFEATLVDIATTMASSEFSGPIYAKQIGRSAPFDAQWVRTPEVGSDD
ncbi:MAG: hypothetical protein RLZZ40_408 [Actinomycetota bacterium]